jgi:hypothetical protein
VRLKAFTVVVILYKSFWVITRCHSGYETNVSGLMFVPSSGWITRRREAFVENNNHGESLQSHILHLYGEDTLRRFI